MNDDEPPTAVTGATDTTPRGPVGAPAASAAPLALMEVAARPPQVFVRGEGSWLCDPDGKRYLDFVQGWAVNSLGHCPRDRAGAGGRRRSASINPSPAFYNEPMASLAERWRRGERPGAVFFANSGAEANEGAIKLARKWGAVQRGGASEIITLDHGFHGRTLATMSASGKPAGTSFFEPKVPGFPKAPLNDLAAVERLIDAHDRRRHARADPGRGRRGAGHREFLQALRALCDQRGLLLILDEVQTGIGRTGRLFAYQHAGVRPTS